jgi:two-component system chemotaxis response regulator CheB
MRPHKIVIIGSSAGGPRILRELFTGIPFLDGSIVIVQHMPKFVNESLRDHLNNCTDMMVSVAQDGDRLEKGRVYVAPSEVHLELVNNQRIRLFNGEKVNFARPSVDVTMKSLKNEPRFALIGIILTGMGRDGAEGISHIKNIGGITIAQNEMTCAVYGMPKKAIETGNIDWVLKPDRIKDKLVELMGVI